MTEPGRAPQLSVVMSLLSPDPGYLTAAVQSCLDQTFGDFELIILDNPAARTGREVIEGFQDSRIRYQPLAHRVPLTTSRQRGLEEARGEYLAILDGDDLAKPSRFEQQVELLRTRPDITLVGCQLEVIDATGETLGYRHYPTAHANIIATMPRYNPIAQPAVMLRREAALAAGGYRAEFAVCEDYDLWSRMALRGDRLANLPQTLVSYRVHGESTKATRLKETLGNTIAIKQRYWSAKFSLRDRLRLFGEYALLTLPPSLVTKLFLRLSLESNEFDSP